MKLTACPLLVTSSRHSQVYYFGVGGGTQQFADKLGKHRIIPLIYVNIQSVQEVVTHFI